MNPKLVARWTHFLDQLLVLFQLVGAPCNHNIELVKPKTQLTLEGVASHMSQVSQPWSAWSSRTLAASNVHWCLWTTHSPSLWENGNKHLSRCGGWAKQNLHYCCIGWPISWVPWLSWLKCAMFFILPGQQLPPDGAQQPQGLGTPHIFVNQSKHSR